MQYSIKKVLYIKLNSLPESIQNQVRKYDGGMYDYRYWSELSPMKGDWSENVNMNFLLEYYEDETKCKNFSGSLDEFVFKYELLLDKYLIDQNISLKDIVDIIIE